MYTPPELLERARDGAILHVDPGAGVHLIQVPVVPWGAYFPALQNLAQPPAQIVAAHTARLDEPERARCRQVWTRLTERQRELVRLLAAGLHPQQAADEMCISLATVNTHKTVILDECRVAWGLSEDEYLSYHFIQQKFGPWLEQSPTPPD
jgi:CRISPR-associated protein Csx14